MQGGFVGSSGGFEGSPMKEKPQQLAGLRNVTIKQIQESQSAFPDGPLLIDGKEISQVTFIGRVNKANVSPSNMQYVVEDGTASIEVRQYSDMNENEEQSIAPFQEGSFVRIIGQAKRFQQKKFVAAYKISVVNSLNEIAHHQLSVVKTHLGLTKPKRQEAVSVNPLAQAFGQSVPVFGEQYTPVQKKLLGAVASISASDDLKGGNRSDIIAKLRGVATADQVNQELEYLVDQGILYNTVDEDHFRMVG